MEDLLIITIEYEIAPRADNLGELFSALARDYKDITNGRVLVVTSIEHGSIIATLTDWAVNAIPYVKDAVELAKGAKAVADFGKILKEWIDGANTGKKKQVRRRGRKSPGQRSIKAILKVAADNGRSVWVKHTNAEGDTFEVEMSGPQAVKLREDAFADQASAVERKYVPPEVTPARIPPPDLKQAIDRLYEPGIDLSSGSADAIIDALVDVLQAANLDYLIPQIVADLKNQGMHALAALLEARAHRSDGKHEPPLTTA
jgi:hypothetical protein